MKIIEVTQINYAEEIKKAMNNKKWPPILQAEMADEWVLANPDQGGLDFVNALDLQSDAPQQVPLKQLLTNQSNIGSVTRTPQEVVSAINQKWGTQIKMGQQFDQNPRRYFQYAKMPASTAKPSIMVDGEIFMGVGRFIAALLRGDPTLEVWNFKKNQNFPTSSVPNPNDVNMLQKKRAGG